MGNFYFDPNFNGLYTRDYVKHIEYVDLDREGDNDVGNNDRADEEEEEVQQVGCVHIDVTSHVFTVTIQLEKALIPLFLTKALLYIKLSFLRANAF